MKNILVVSGLFFSLISLDTFSEEYVCSVSYPESEEIEVKTYERNGNIFQQTSQFGEKLFQITNETEEFLILNDTFDFPIIFIVFLDKKNENIVEEFINFGKTDSFSRITGKCLIKN